MGGTKLLTMTSREKIEKIREVIKEYELDKPGRQRGKVYMRFYLFNLLKREQFNRVETGQEFNMAHCTVVHGLTQHDNLKKDKLYIRYTQHLRDIFEGVDEEEISLNKAQDLKADVLKCENFWQMVKIQNDIKDGLYGDVTM